MTDKEKLIALIAKFCGDLTIHDIQPPYGFENLADYLISNGVSFSSRAAEAITMPLGNGVCLVAERNTDPAFPNEVFIGLRNGQTWWQDLAVVRAAYQINSDLTTQWSSDEFEVLVYADKDNEDYTDKFQIELYREDALED